VVDSTVYFGTDKNVYALDAADGTQPWTYDTGAYRVESSPAVVDGTVYLGTLNTAIQDGNVYALTEQ
jgi:outer membrane protein assembly factor BamB